MADRMVLVAEDQLFISTLIQRHCLMRKTIDGKRAYDVIECLILFNVMTSPKLLVKPNDRREKRLWRHCVHPCRHQMFSFRPHKDNVPEMPKCKFDWMWDMKNVRIVLNFTMMLPKQSILNSYDVIKYDYDLIKMNVLTCTICVFIYNILNPCSAPTGCGTYDRMWRTYYRMWHSCYNWFIACVL